MKDESDFIDEAKYKEYYDFIDFIMNMAIKSQHYEIAAWIRGVKKELGYSIVFEEDLTIEDFLNLVNHRMDNLDEKNRKLIIYLFMILMITTNCSGFLIITINFNVNNSHDIYQFFFLLRNLGSLVWSTINANFHFLY